MKFVTNNMISSLEISSTAITLKILFFPFSQNNKKLCNFIAVFALRVDGVASIPESIWL